MMLHADGSEANSKRNTQSQVDLVTTENFKAAARNFLFVLAAPVDKRKMNTTTSCPKHNTTTE